MIIYRALKAKLQDLQRRLSITAEILNKKVKNVQRNEPG
jgi:hypothetical protein